MKSLCGLVIALSIILSVYNTVNAQTMRSVSIVPRSPSGEELKGHFWLFVIGIDNYSGWTPLQTAVNGAKNLKNILIERYNFDSSHVIELYNADATRKNILEKLRYLAQNVSQQDSVLIYYAGHGHLDPITKKGRWIPVESGLSDVSSWVSNDDIKDYLRSDVITARHILLISDSCFAGDFFRGSREALPTVTDSVIKRAYELSSRQALTSGGLEPVSDSGFGGDSVFTYFLIKSLKDNQKPFLIPSDFFNGIRAGVAENAKQVPQLGPLRDTGGQQGGEFVFVLKQGQPQDNGTLLEDLKAKALARTKELSRLKELEDSANSDRAKEQAEISALERKIADLDEKIEAMKRRLGAGTPRKDDSLDRILVMVKEKELADKRLQEMKMKRDLAEKRRAESLEQLSAKERDKRRASLNSDLRKYEEIAASPYGADMKTAAWQAIIASYPEAKSLSPGDSDGLRRIYNEVPSEHDSTTGIDFMHIKGGCFKMGDTFGDGGQDEQPVHEVCLDDFYIGRHEVTQGQWKKVMGAANNPSEFKNCGDNCPVERVSWDDTMEFIKKLNGHANVRYSLPTEAQWEYACRSAGRNVRFGTGKDTIGPDEANIDGNSKFTKPYSRHGISRGRTTPVATFSPNETGLYDMSGNVYEWVSDWYDEDGYKRHKRQNPVNDRPGAYRVIRGGSFANAPGCGRCSFRSYFSPDSCSYRIGFRLIMQQKGK